jgi:hypothetical protein
MHLNDDAPRMFSDTKVRDDIQTTVTTFLANEGLIEEVACDVCAIDCSIEHALRTHPDRKDQYINGYYKTARLNMLALYVVRTLAKAAGLVIQEIRDGRLQRVKHPT